jgi:AcrR family transcriptional regulator
MTKNKLRTRSRLEVDARRAQLLSLGLALFSGHTYEEVSIDEVAAQAGISKGLLYHYFPTKRAFYLAVLQEAARDLVERTAVDPNLPEIERAKAGLDVYLAFVAQRGPAYVALMRGGLGYDPEVAQVVEETRLHFLRRTFSGLGLGTPPPLLRVALRGWIGCVEAASLDWVERADLPREAVRDLLLQSLFSLLQQVIPNVEISLPARATAKETETPSLNPAKPKP